MESYSKKCSKCKQSKDVKEYSKCKKNKDGLQSECKSCSKERRNNIIQSDPLYFNKAYKKYLNTHQKISKKIDNPRYIQFPKDSEEYKELFIIRSREFQKKYREKQETKEKLKLYNEKHKVKFKLRAKERYEIIKNDKEYIQKKRERNKLWYSNNKERSKIRFHKRRAKIKGCGGNHTKDDLDNIFKNQHGKCAICKKSINNKKHIDHIIPISKNGSNDKHNIQLLCPSCNIRKKDKDPIDFMQSLGFLL